MDDRARARVAVGAAVVAGAALVGCQLVLHLTATPGRGGVPSDGPTTLVTLLVLGPFVAVGGVLSARRPRHPIGWLLLALGVAGAGLSVGGLLHGLAQDPWVRSLGAWIDAGLWHPSFPALGLLFLLFPTGRPPTRRWRWVQHALVASWIALVTTGPFTTPDLLLEFYPDAGPVVPGPWSPAVGSVHDTVQFLVVFPLLIVSVASMVVRARRSTGVERQQLRWFAASVVVIAVAFPLSLTLLGDGSIGAPFFALLPISCAVAVLRHRLYDLDRLISRTVGYTLVVAVLVGGYLAGVLVLRGLLPVQGGDLAVAASTLLVAGLFDPVRRRVLRAVDRRFNRARYDADERLGAFVASMRVETDLAELSGDLVTLVRDTLQPAAVSVWFEPAPVSEAATGAPRSRDPVG